MRSQRGGVNVGIAPSLCRSCCSQMLETCLSRVGTETLQGEHGLTPGPHVCVWWSHAAAVAWTGPWVGQTHHELPTEH